MKIEFIGKFKDLIPMGYSFHKLYARNYRVYTKNSVWIWVAGRSVEIKDLSESNSFDIAKLIINKEYPVYTEDKDYGIVLFKKGDPKSTILDTKTGEVVIRHDFMKVRNYDFNYDFDRYKELILHVDIFDTINELHQNNMINL